TGSAAGSPAATSPSPRPPKAPARAAHRQPSGRWQRSERIYFSTFQLPHFIFPLQADLKVRLYQPRAVPLFHFSTLPLYWVPADGISIPELSAVAFPGRSGSPPPSILPLTVCSLLPMKATALP